VRDDSDRGRRHGKIDDDIGSGFADDADRHADITDASDEAGIFAEQRVIGRLERGNDFKARVLRGKGRDSLAHPASRSVDGEFHSGSGK
jgi:hypothetical protein